MTTSLFLTDESSCDAKTGCDHLPLDAATFHTDDDIVTICSLSLANRGKDSLPLPIGVLYRTSRSCYENDVVAQVQKARQDKPPKGDPIDGVLRAGETWVVA